MNREKNCEDMNPSSSPDAFHQIKNSDAERRLAAAYGGDVISNNFKLFVS